jgi:hypothetical protein
MVSISASFACFSEVCVGNLSISYLVPDSYAH